MRAKTTSSDEQLRAAIRAGDVDAVKKALKDGANPTAIGPSETRPLHWLVEDGYSQKTARMLLSAGSPIDVRDAHGRTALFLAAQLGLDGPASSLVDLGADAMACDERGYSPFHAAAALPDGVAAEKIVDALASVPYSDPDRPAPDGETPSSVAATREARRALRRAHKVLSESDGGAPREIDEQMMRAVRSLHHDNIIDEVLKCLRAGADPNYVNKNGETALYVAAGAGNWELIEVLMASGADVDPKRDFDGRTPLIVAAIVGAQQCLETLARNGADVDARDDGGSTALSLTPHYNIAKKLLDLGADPNVERGAKRVPLNRAIVDLNAGLTRLLLKAGADPWNVDARGESAVSLVKQIVPGATTQTLGIKIQEMVLEAAKKQMRSRELPSESAGCRWRPEDIIEAIRGDVDDPYEKKREDLLWVLDHGAEPNELERGGHLPLVYAARTGEDWAVEILLDYGADLRLRDVSGQDAVEAASTDEVKKLLLSALKTKTMSDELPSENVDPTAKKALSKRLVKACERNEAALVEKLLSAGADPDSEVGGKTALGVVLGMSHYGNIDVVHQIAKALLDAGADPNKKSGPDDESPVGIAALRGASGDYDAFRATQTEKNDCIKLLIGRGADPNVPDAKGEFPIFHSLRRCFFATVKSLIKFGADTSAIDPNTGDTLLHDAIKRSSGAGAWLLKDSWKTLVKTRDRDGNTPLHVAVSVFRPRYDFEKLSLVKHLVAHGADVFAENDERRIPMDLVKEPEEYAIKNFLQQEMKSAIASAERDHSLPSESTVRQENRLHEAYLAAKKALHEDDPEKLEQILRREPEVVKHRGGLDVQTLLHWAVHESSLWGVKLLVDLGSRLEERNLDGRTPLFLAVVDPSKNSEIVDFLLASGADAEAVTTGADKTTALNAAIKRSFHRAVSSLIRAGADVDGRDNSGNTPLCTAVNARSLKTARELLRAGADVNKTNSYGAAPLFLAVANRYSKKNSLELVRLLLASGAKVDAENFVGITALGKAAAVGDAREIQILLDAGADPSHVDKTGKTVLDRDDSGELRKALLKTIETAPVHGKLPRE